MESAMSKKDLSKKKIESLILAEKKSLWMKKAGLFVSAINLGLEVLETPEVDKWVEGQLNARQFQRVKLEDLLGREPIELNME